jgi:NTP pyrophosphatase (non-canonical NTP hydrolase)
MDIKDVKKEFCKLVTDYNQKNNLTQNPETIFHHLVEEGGELSREIQKEKNDWRKEGFVKKDLEKEINDIMKSVRGKFFNGEKGLM